MVKTMLIPPAWSHRMAIDAGAPRPVQLLQLRHGAVGRPGRDRSPPTARWVVAGLDRNGLRPMRYSRTSDGLLVVGSETGMVPLVDE